MDSEQNITIATSIAPYNLLVQKQAISSWINYGFCVISINSAEEINDLQNEFPMVQFIEAKRNAKAKYGKPYIYFDEVLDYFRSSDSAICGIVNSDIHFINFSDKLFQLIVKESRQSIVYGSRIDIENIDNLNGNVYAEGFDFFFFDKDIIPCYPKQEFCIGLPWWDYWAVLAPIQQGVKAKRLLTPFAYHVKHSTNWNKDYWSSLGMILSEHLSISIVQNDECIGNFGYDVIALIEKDSIYIFLKDDVRNSHIIFVYDNSELKNAESKTYESIVNQSYPHKSIAFGNHNNFSLEMEADYVCFIEEGNVLHPNFADIILSTISDHDIAFCNLKIYKPNINVFRISTPVFEKGEISKLHRQCIIYKYDVFFQDGKFRVNNITEKKAHFVGHALVHTSYENHIIKQLQGKKNIYIYGSGGHTKQLLEMVDFRNFDIKGIIDSKPSITHLYGYPIYAFDEIKSWEFDCILISSYSFESEIYEKLIKVINEDKIIRIYYNTV